MGPRDSRILFTFRGWCYADIKKATDTDGKTVDVSKMPRDELADALNEGKLFISLADHVYGHRKNEVQLLDFEVRTPYHEPL